MRNLVLALMTWTLIALVAALVIPYHLAEGCGNLGHLTDECIGNTTYIGTHFPMVIYRYPIILLVAGYLVLIGFAFWRRRRRIRSSVLTDVSILSRIAGFLRGDAGSGEGVLPRRERRSEARDRHHSTGEPAWTSADRLPGRPGPREVQDVAPGTPGEFGSHRIIDDL